MMQLGMIHFIESLARVEIYNVHLFTAMKLIISVCKIQIGRFDSPLLKALAIILKVDI